MARKILSLVLSFGLLFQQISFAQVALELNLVSYLSRFGSNIVQDKFRPIHLRYFSYDSLNDSFKLLVDKGDELNKGNEGKGKENKEEALKDKTQPLLNYFLIGVTLPDSMFWVNLRPDSEDQIIDQYLEKTDAGKIMLETDLQLKKDTALFTSPNTAEGREYWTKLYQKAEELYGYEAVTIPTLTRPWIVPGEIILRESKDSAYVYKANLKVMLEQDYLKDSTFSRGAGSRLMTDSLAGKDERSRALNEYSSQLIRELIIPKLTKKVNSSKRYANFRQVYYSLILSRWFKNRYSGKTGTYAALINTQDLTNLISKDAWSKNDYFKQYQKSFSEGEYNVKEPVYTPTGQVIRSYFSGGIQMDGINNPNSFTSSPISPKIFNSGIFLEGSFKKGLNIVRDFLTPPDRKSLISKDEFLTVYEGKNRNIREVAAELKISESMAEHYKRIYVSSNPMSAGSPVTSEKKESINLLGGVTQENVLRAYEANGHDLIKTAFAVGGLNLDTITAYIEDAKRKKKGSSPITTQEMSNTQREYYLLDAHNRIGRRARSGPYIDLLNEVVLNDEGILSNTVNRSLLNSATASINRVLREYLVRHPRSSYSDERILLNEIVSEKYNLIKDFGMEEPLNTLAEIAAERLAALMVLKKNQLLSILYSDNPRAIILSNVLKEKGYTVKSPEQVDVTAGSFTLLVNFATTLDKVSNLLDCESKFKLLANAAIMVLPDISTDTGMLTAIRIFSRARALYDAAASATKQGGSATNSVGSSPVREDKTSVGSIEKRIAELENNIVENWRRIDKINEVTGVNINEISDIGVKGLDTENKRNIRAILSIRDYIYEMVGELNRLQTQKELGYSLTVETAQSQNAPGSESQTSGSEGASSVVQTHTAFLRDALNILSNEEKLGSVVSDRISNLISPPEMYRRILFSSEWAIDIKYDNSTGRTYVSLTNSAGTDNYKKRYEYFSILYYETKSIVEYLRNEIKAELDASSSTPQALSPNQVSLLANIPETTGGIDLRALPMTIQPMGSFKGLNFSLPNLSQEQLKQINIASEIEQIKNMVKAGNIPSGDRLKELIAACCQKQQINSQIDNLLLCLIDICKLEEENALESSSELREALVIVDSLS